MVNVFSLFANWDINCSLCFCIFVLSPWMLQLIIEYKLVCHRKLELDSSPTSCCSIVVVHCASLHIKKYGHLQLCPFVSFAGTHPGYWGVGCGIEVGCRCLQLLCQCFFQAHAGSIQQHCNWLVRSSHADRLAPRPPAGRKIYSSNSIARKFIARIV